MARYSRPASRVFETYESIPEAVSGHSSRKSRNGGKVPKVQTGTGLANIDISKSCATFSDLALHTQGSANGKRAKRKRSAHSHSAGARRSIRGGARNSASRTSDSITLDAAENLIAAAGHAERIGLPFTRFITIHWQAAGIVDSDAAEATAAFIKLASDWLRTRGHKTGSLWVRENPEGKGSHVHIAIHVPAGETLGRMQRRWLRRIIGKLRNYKKGSPDGRWRYRKGVIKTEPIGRSTRAAFSDPDGYRLNLENVLAYVLKGASPDAAAELRLKRLEPQGRIIGKRTGTSQNIGRAARSRGAG